MSESKREGALHLVDERATAEFAATLAQHLGGGFVIFLQGQLGSGKTTLVRGILRSLGHAGAVKSPTYTLVEPYDFEGLSVYHFDLYRLGDPEELELLGIRDYFNSDSVAFIEWPQCGQGFLPAADLELSIEVRGKARDVTWRANNEKAAALMAALGE
jgi:tRNA threonylcarbamoyladenosine biosynthesis protein TsaE